jgi:hypothetical protein
MIGGKTVAPGASIVLSTVLSPSLSFTDSNISGNLFICHGSMPLYLLYEIQSSKSFIILNFE